MWSAAVFAPALPGLSMIAAHCPAPSAPWSNQAVRGWWPNPPLKVGAAPSLAECASTRVASTSITSGLSALIPAAGECSPARDHTRRRTSPRAASTAASTASASWARVLTRRQTVGSEATWPKSSPWLRSTDRSDRHRPPRAAHRARSTMILPGSCTARGLRQGARAPDNPTSRPTARTVPVSSLAPAGPTAGTSPASAPACGYNPVPFTTRAPLPWTRADIDNPHYPRTRSTLTPPPAPQTTKNRG